MKAGWRILAAVFLAVLSLLRGARPNGNGVSRCLIIGYDRFVTMADTAPCSANNAEIMTALLADFTEKPEKTVRRVNGPGTAEGLEALIRETFRGAGEADVSYLYISTHGVIWEENGENRMALVLSDGRTEEAMEPQRLRAVLDEIPGQKVLILDACHSGAVIDSFRSPEYQVLTSSGAEEDSYFWQADSAEETGTGYFTTALESVLRTSYPRQIDTDGDGSLTVPETVRRLGDIYGASRATGYPEDGDRRLFRFPEEREDRERILGLEFDPVQSEEDVLVLPFRFTVTEETRIEYRIVIKRDGEWDFEQGTTIPDRERTGTVRGLLSPGDKERKIRISPSGLGDEGEALLQVISLRGIHGQVPVLEGTRVISVRGSDSGDQVSEVNLKGDY